MSCSLCPMLPPGTSQRQTSPVLAHHLCGFFSSPPILFSRLFRLRAFPMGTCNYLDCQTVNPASRQIQFPGRQTGNTREAKPRGCFQLSAQRFILQRASLFCRAPLYSSSTTNIPQGISPDSQLYFSVASIVFFRFCEIASHS
jgi:hypothetical protein